MSWGLQLPSMWMAFNCSPPTQSPKGALARPGGEEQRMLSLGDKRSWLYLWSWVCRVRAVATQQQLALRNQQTTRIPEPMQDRRILRPTGQGSQSMTRAQSVSILGRCGSGG